MRRQGWFGRGRARLRHAAGERASKESGAEWWFEIGPDPVPRLHDRAVVPVALLGTDVLVFRTRAGVFAFENKCPHNGLKLTGARISSRQLTCSGHGWKFRLDDGSCITAGRRHHAQLRTWPADTVAGVLRLRVRVSGPSGGPTE